MRRVTFFGIVGGVILALIIVGLTRVRPTHAQTGSQDVAIAQGPGGMWVVRGAKLFVCSQSTPQVGQVPAKPRCGKPADLR